MRSIARSTNVEDRPIGIVFGHGNGSLPRNREDKAVYGEWRIRERSANYPYVPCPLVPVLNLPPPSQITHLLTYLPTQRSASHSDVIEGAWRRHVGTRACLC